MEMAKRLKKAENKGIFITTFITDGNIDNRCDSENKKKGFNIKHSSVRNTFIAKVFFIFF